MVRSVRSAVLKFALASVLAVAACGDPEAFHAGEHGSHGGETGSGGGIIVGSGGSGATGSGSGGAISASGGATSSTGGRMGTGGASVSSGGTTASGGRVGTGGASSGGAPASGGTTATGGRGGTGGVSSGGAPVSSGGTTASGGRVGTGGAASGGATASGGRVGTGGAMATGVLFTDNFESGAGKWTASTPGDWSVVSDGSMVYKQSATSNQWRGAAASMPAVANVVVESRVKILSFNGTSSTYLAAVCARVTDANNRYCLGLRSDGKISIRKTVAGTGNNGAAVNVTNGVTLNTWYLAKLQVVGSAITGTLSLNGAQVGVATDTDASITSGGIELGTTNAVAEFDDVKVSAP
jgi:hypothetical protein